VVLVLVQVPLFWHGSSMVHAVLEILQLLPMVSEFEQVGGTKICDACLTR